MKTVLAKISKLVRQIRGLFPSPIPVGMDKFDEFTSSIINTYDLPTSDLDSIKFSIATMIMHLGQKEASKPKYHFVLALRAAAAKQIASAQFYEIKTRQAAKAKEAEATANSQVASDGPQKT